MKTEVEIDTLARKLAIHHIQSDVDRGISEREIAMSWHGSGRGHEHWHDAEDGFGGYDVTIGGYYDKDTSTGLMRKRVGNDKILVSEVYGVKGVWIFSLHEIYQEAKGGQLTLL